MISCKAMLTDIARLPLRCVPKEAVVRVVCGANRGAKWVVGSSLHRCWIGFFEWEKQKAMTSLLRPGTLFFDVGAHVGFYSLLAARRGCRVVAVEPAARNLEFLQRNVAANHLESDISVVPAGVADVAGFASFDIGPSPSEGKLSEQGSVRVSVTTLDEITNRFGQPDYVKMDIEGGEVAALRGAAELLNRRQTIFFVALHGTDAERGCQELLRNYRYDISSINGHPDEIIATPAQVR